MSKHKVVNDSNYAPIHAIGAYISQFKLKQKLEKNKHKNK